MPVVKQRKDWTRQPQIITGVDWSNPITQGLLACWMPGISNHDLANRQFDGTIGDAFKSEAVSQGKAFVPNPDGRLNCLTAAQATEFTDAPLSFFAVAYTKNKEQSPNQYVFGNHGSNKGFGFQFLTSGKMEIVHGVNNDNWAYAQVTCQNNVPLTGVVSIPPGVNQSMFFVDGKKLTPTRTGSNTYAKSDKQIWIARHSNSYGNGLNGGVLLAGIYSRALSEAEGLSLSANPWQIFRP